MALSRRAFLAAVAGLCAATAIPAMPGWAENEPKVTAQTYWVVSGSGWTDRVWSVKFGPRTRELPVPPSTPPGFRRRSFTLVCNPDGSGWCEQVDSQVHSSGQSV